jgi:hypothetical protein
LDCKLVQNGERIEGLCPLCGEKTSHRALNEPRSYVMLVMKIYSFIIPGLKDDNKCPKYKFTEVKFVYDG